MVSTGENIPCDLVIFKSTEMKAIMHLLQENQKTLILILKELHQITFLRLKMSGFSELNVQLDQELEFVLE